MNKSVQFFLVLILITVIGLVATKADDIIIVPPSNITNITNITNNYTNITNNYTNITGTNFTLNTTGHPPIANWSTITCSNGNVCSQSGQTIDIAAPGDVDNFVTLVTASGGLTSSGGFTPNIDGSNKINKTNDIIRDLFTGDGITLNFTTTNNITSGSSMVYLNGLLEAYQIIYTEYSHSINFTYAPPNSDDIEVDYVKG